jgi:hypothetical protein
VPKKIKSDAPLANAQPGDEFVFTHPQESGFGEHALFQALTAEDSGPVDRPLSAEMMELDLIHGTVVRLLEFDADSGWPLIEWTDLKKIGRITTIDPQYMDLFVPYER